MKISYNWLNELIQTECTPEQISELLTGSGLEVDGLEAYQSIKGGLDGIVIGEVKTCEKHPNADRLRVTTVDIGQPELLHIVCGAPNVAAGQKVLVATVGCMVYPTQGEPFEIKKSKIRGEISEGMICAEDELSLGNSHNGILVLPEHYEVGKPAHAYFNVYNDHLIEIGLTANRGDAASHLGVARDLKALTGKNITIPVKSDIQLMQTSDDIIQVEVTDTEGCIRYSGICMTQVSVKPSPEWLQNKLKVIGLTPINNVVDATNFVLHELGQPLHAFDLSKITGNTIKVRKANPTETITTLDKAERKLTGTECMICDAEKPLAIGGVFGGLDSGISDSTTTIFIESACFNPSSIRKTAKHHGLSTDASFRFERGTNPNITLLALTRVVEILSDIAGAVVHGKLIDIYPTEVKPVVVNFSISRFHKLIGQEIALGDIKRILLSLDFELTNSTDEQTLTLKVPTYRTDVTREADVAEEILRIYGLNNIGIPHQLKSTLTKSGDEQNWLLRNNVSDFLAANGFIEMLSNSLTKSAYHNQEDQTNAVKLLNPLSSDLDIMRMSMLYNGLEMLQYNRNRKITDIKAFEFGYTYNLQQGKYTETPHLALFVTGNKTPETWQQPAQTSTVYQLKSIAEQTLLRCGIANFTFEYNETHPTYPVYITMYVNKICIGYIGLVDPKICQTFDLEQEVYTIDFYWSAIIEARTSNTFKLQLPSPYPAVRRDLALLIDQSVTYDTIEKIVKQCDTQLIQHVNAFDVYQGDKIQSGKKSYAISITMQDDEKTLTDAEVEKLMNKVLQQLNKQTGAALRS